MSREIKFRAWLPSKKSMQMAGQISWWFDACAEAGLNPLKTQPDSILMQFTGLTDKNGKEIFEGDILATDYNEKGAKIGVTKGVVTWDEKNMCYYSKEKADNGQMVNTYMKHMFEVIGNVYENPELLEGGTL